MSTVNDIWGDRSQAPGPRGSSIGLEKTSGYKAVIYRKKPSSIDPRQPDQTQEERAEELAKAIEASDRELKSELGS